MTTHHTSGAADLPEAYKIAAQAGAAKFYPDHQKASKDTYLVTAGFVERFYGLCMDRSAALTGENHAQLDMDSNASEPGQQRELVGALAVGQHVGDRAHETAGNPCAERDVSLRSVAVRNLRSFLHSATFKSESDRQAALTCVDVLQEARPAPPAMDGGEDAARLLRQILAASQDGDSDTRLSAHFVSRIETITKPGGAA